MHAEPQVPQSRRALLVGALTGVATMVAAALGHPSAADAAAGSHLVLGSSANSAGTSDTIVTTNSPVVALEAIQNGASTGLMGYAKKTTGSTRGVYGRANSPDGDGVQARNAGAAGNGAALRAFGGNNVGIEVGTDSPTSYALRAVNYGGGTAVVASSGLTGSGVYATSPDGYGVWAKTGTGVAVYAQASSTDALAGSFVGRVQIFGQLALGAYVDLAEIATPDNPPAGAARLFAREDVSGKTQLCAQLGGATVVLATQP